MRRSFFQKLAKIFIELLIVFIGVYLAFQLNNYKEEAENQRIRNNYYKVLSNEFEYTAQNIKQVADQLEAFASRLDAKEKLQLSKLQRLDLSDNMYVLKSAFNSGYFENIDQKYINNIGRGANHLDKVSTLLRNYNNKIQNVLIANSFENSIFYDEDGTLKNNYFWVKEELDYIIYYLKMLEKVIVEEAIPDTKSLIE
jgi:uncharacterized membrane protein YgaE (UPF0421/DUF939 family)